MLRQPRGHNAAQRVGHSIQAAVANSWQAPKRSTLLLRVGAAKKEAGRACGFVKLTLPQPDKAVTRETFRFETDKAKLDKAKLKQARDRDGRYLPRSNRQPTIPSYSGRGTSY